MDFEKLIAARRAACDGLIARREALGSEGAAILAGVSAEARSALNEAEEARHLAIIEERASLTTQIADAERGIALLEADRDADAAATRSAAERNATGVREPVARVGAEPRTYAREIDPLGRNFARDVALSQVLGDLGASQRLSRHMDEERVDRAAAGKPLMDRANGTANFAGLVVPQYLVDEFAPLARAGRPFADAIRRVPLPEQGMTVSFGKLTTGSTVTDQTAEGDTASETDTDDTLETIPVRTSSGAATTSRQAVERGQGIDDTIIEDLIRAHDVNRDSRLLNMATYGLSAVATAIAYTDGTPTAVELYPKLLQGPAAVEAALLDQGAGDTLAVMHSRRWYWLQSQLTTSFPLFGQPGVPGQLSGVNYGEKYGAGFRGVLPSGVAVIVDNNIATNLGAGTNEDEIYFLSPNESRLWEDPAQPYLIKAETSQAKKLQIEFVVYSYYAFTHTRRPNAQKIGGTGLVTPTF